MRVDDTQRMLVEAVVVNLRAYCDDVRAQALAELDRIGVESTARLDAAAAQAQAEIAEILRSS